MTLRETSANFVPSLPVKMPSENVLVLKAVALPPPSCAPFSPSSACYRYATHSFLLTLCHERLDR